MAVAEWLKIMELRNGLPANQKHPAWQMLAGAIKFVSLSRLWLGILFFVVFVWFKSKFQF